VQQEFPNRHIPVGQGFFVVADASGGNITFKNSQRAFRLETDNSVTGSNPMFRAAQNEEGNLENDTFKRVRLDFQSATLHEKQILLGFMDNLATNGLENGYDAKALDTTPSDIYFDVEGEKLVIQGVGSFDTNTQLNLGIKNEIAGVVKIKVNALENFSNNQEVYILDTLTNTYYPIHDTNVMELNLPAGEFTNRFKVTFTNGVLNNGNDVTLENEVNLYANEKDIYVNSTTVNLEGKKIELYSVLGQKVFEKELSSNDQIINVSALSSNTYIVKLYLDQTTITKKVILK
jgi:hypothetical protein